MPRTSKPKTATEVVEKNVVAAPVQNVETKPVTKQAAPKKSSTKETTPKVEKTVETPVPEVSSQNVMEETVVDIEASVAAQSVEFLAKLNQLSVIISSLKNEYKTLEKKWTRELKVAQKVNSKRKRKTGNRTPSGFVKPTKISDELANFLEKPLGAEMARTDVTREINKYIRAHNLQDKENGRKINPDTKLSSLLKLKNTDELTYFNLQKYMSPHFAKSTKDVAQVV
uniref:DM2 domain-containing protein n=1 Tax=viral metagenome TaxID=1070528 RepID=A0A6C0E346_9ZZZZ